MKLKEYIDSFPRNQRRQVREKLAIAHGVSKVTIRPWVNGIRRYPFTKQANRDHRKVHWQKGNAP